MICPQCHSENREGAKFCDECGASLRNLVEPRQTAPDEAAQRDELACDAQEGDASEDLETAQAGEEAPLADEAEGARDESVAEASASGSADEEPEEDAQAPAEDGEAEDESCSDDVPDACDARADAADADDADEDEDEEPEEAVEPARAGSSGALDPATLPVIDVPGLNVDDRGRAFSPEPDASASKTADLSGLDEYLVSPGYVPPRGAWHTGDTLEMPRIDGQTVPQQKDYRAPDASKKRFGKGKAALVALLVVAVLGAAAAGITYYLELWGGKMLPDVTGMTQADATYVLEGKGFVVRVETEKSDEAEGVVLSMEPGAGAREEEGTEVAISVSEARTVPDVEGLGREEAAAALAEDGFENVEFRTEKSDEAEGTVLSVEPAAGTKAKSADPITVTLSESYSVPDVAGMTWDEAVSALEKAGYKAEQAYVYDETEPDGTILGTDPKAGSKEPSGSTITVNTARSRAAELEAAALSYLSGVGTLSLEGTAFEIQSVDGVSYEGNNTTAFTVTGTAVTTLDGETVRGSARQKTGVIVWDDANNVVSVS